MGALARVGPGQASLLGLHGPPCPLGSLLGQQVCPGCGLTRATALTLQGQPGLALAVHPAGPLVALFALLGVVLNLLILARGQASPGQEKLLRLGRVTFSLGLILCWLTRLLS